MKSRFVTLASHEFKTPLSVILSSTVLIEKYNGPDMGDKRLHHIQRIRNNVKNLRQILGDFLSLEKLEAGVVRNSPANIDLIALIGEAIQDMEGSCKAGQAITLEVRGEKRIASLDENLLRNILNNLLSNAVKYSPEESAIHFTLQFQQDRIVMSIADRGIGIPPEEQAQLFERFFRATNTAGIPGTGLGLSIVKRYIDLMGGTISVWSEPAQGTTFTISLPAVGDMIFIS
jgi:signal transduction histidine kinase